MESQPQNPEFSDYPENFHPCILCARVCQKLSEHFVRFIVVMSELILTRLTEE